MRERPITEYAEQLLQHVHFVDMHGHKIGYDYQRILDLIKQRFPKSRMTLGGLRNDVRYKMAIRQMSMPSHPKVYNGSRRKLAHDFTRALLMQRDERGVGLSFRLIRRKITENFPDEPKLSLIRAEKMLEYRHPGLMPTERKRR